MIRRHAAGFRALLIGADLVTAFSLPFVLSALRFGEEWLAWWREMVPNAEGLLAIYAVSWVGALALNGLYRPRARWSILRESADILRATVVIALITLSVLFIFRLPDVSRLFLLILFPTHAATTIVSRIVIRLAMERKRRAGQNQRFVLVLGADARAQAFAAKMDQHRELGLQVLGFLDDTPPGDLPNGWRYLGPLADLESVLHTQVVDEVVLCLPFSQWSLIDAIAVLCEEEGKIVRIPMDMLERAVSVGRVEDLDGTPVYSLVSGPDRVLSLAIKRVLDLVASTLGLIVLSPVFLAVALAIRSRDGAPILFRQTRVGLHGRSFQVLKFRTMTTDAEERFQAMAHLGHSRGPGFKMDGDPRITPLGALLRRTSLDELPQLWNVLKGEMSLVGPRPAPPREVADYDLWHRRRLSMKPGITGLWQVTARRSNDFDERAELDLSYIDRWSLWLDVQILARTIPAAFEGR